MTSEEYARLCGRAILKAAHELDLDTNSYGHSRLFVLMLTRIMGVGAEEYEVEPGVQKVEVKPFDDLVTDMEEEVADLVAYAVALGHRAPDFSKEVEGLVLLAHVMMQITGAIRDEVSSTAGAKSPLPPAPSRAKPVRPTRRWWSRMG